MGKIVISCGGTGGHFYPGLSVARKFKEKGGEVQLYLTGLHTVKQSATAEGFGIDNFCASSPRMPSNKLLLPIFVLKFLKAFLQAWSFLGKSKPSKVLLMGSFAGVPLGLAAKFHRIPIYLHEGNSVVGKSNRLMSKWAKKLYLSFDIINTDSVQCKTLMTGMPLRPEICESFDKVNKAQCYEKFSLDPEKKTILVFGGSLGARIINNTFLELLPKLDPKSTQVIHLLGAEPTEEHLNLTKDLEITYIAKAYHQDMVELFAIADLVICRAGASSLAEKSLFPNAAIYIPLKIAMDNHQFYNAKQDLSENVKIIEEKDLSVSSLFENVGILLKNIPIFNGGNHRGNRHYLAAETLYNELK